MASTGAIILETAGALIACGGLYDLFTPQLPPNLLSICAGNAAAARLVRELLRALGGSLIAIGVTVTTLVSLCGRPLPHFILIVILILVVPAEGLNALSMYRVRSPYQFPLAFALLTLIGVSLSWPQAIH